MNVVLTGSSSGIGRSLAELLLLRGHRVWGVARSDQSELAKKFPGQFQFSRADLAEWPEAEFASREILKAWPSVDGLVTCAGLQGAIGPAVLADPLQWSATVRANLDGTFYPIRALFPALQKATRRGKVICFSGGGSTKPRPNFSAYGVAKTGVVRLVETLAEEWQGMPIDINAIAPGAINTRLTEEILALGSKIVGEIEYQAALKQKSTGGASLDKVHGLIEFLLSSSSDGIRGRLLSAPWDPWPGLAQHADALAKTDVYTLRRITPEERKLNFS